MTICWTITQGQPKLGAKRLGDRDTAPARAALWLDRPHAVIPASLDLDHAFVEIDI
jgi:hypothetical protein